MDSRPSAAQPGGDRQERGAGEDECSAGEVRGIDAGEVHVRCMLRVQLCGAGVRWDVQAEVGCEGRAAP